MDRTREKPPDIDGYFPCFMNHCDGRFVRRVGKYGPFYGCDQFPACRATRQVRSIEQEYGAAELGVFDEEDIYLKPW
jgi:ssDNA-binding Zn-finger/Zn-ribbon topoisomerase 1